LFQIVRVRDLIGFDLARFGRVFLMSAAISLSVAAVCLSTRPFASLTHPIPNILVGVVGCMIAYAFSVRVILRGNLKWMAG
jgi:hypothetical protein